MEAAVADEAGEARIRFKDDNPAARVENSIKLRKRCARIFQVMKHVEQHEILNALIREAQRVGVLNTIDTGIGKEVRGDASRNHRLQAANSRTDFYSRAGPVRDPFGNLAIEVGVDPPKQGLALQTIIISE